MRCHFFKVSLNASRRPASFAADKAEQNHKRCIAQVESLRRELSKLTAERDAALGGGEGKRT